MDVLQDICFFIAGIFAVAGAIGVVMLRNPFFSVLALVLHLLALAALFLLLHAQFLAAAQIIVYAGAVMVLYLFVAAYVGGVDEPLSPSGPLLTLVCAWAAKPSEPAARMMARVRVNTGILHSVNLSGGNDRPARSFLCPFIVSRR